MVPSVGSSVTVAVVTTAFMGIGQYLYISDGTTEGIFQVASVLSSTSASLTYITDPINTQAGNTVANGATVSPSGFNGTNGTTGQNAYTNTTGSSNTVPNIGSSNSLSVANTAFMTVGQYLSIGEPSGASSFGIFLITSVTSPTTVIIENPGFVGNAVGGTAITALSPVAISPPGVIAPVVLYATGTEYTVTATSAVITFGTSGAVTITLPYAGTWRLTGRVRYDVAASTTFDASSPGTNNLITTTMVSNTAGALTPTAGFIANQSPTYNASTLSVVEWDIIYPTANFTDTISLFSKIQVIPGAGNLFAAEASLVAQFLHV